MLTLVSISAAIAASCVAWLLMLAGRRALTRYRDVFTHAARVQLSEVFLFIDPMQLWLANLLGCMGSALLVFWFSSSVVVAAAVGVVCALLPRHLMKRFRRRRLQRFDAQLPDALLALALAVRSGAGTTSALRQIVADAPTPLAQEFGLLLREQRVGVTLDTALLNLALRMPSEATMLMVSALRIASDTGGGLAEALERIAATVRARLHMEGRITALTAQGRMQAWVVGCLPIVLAMVLHRLEPHAMAQLWSSPMGWATIAIVVAMELVGLWLIRRIVRIDV